MVIDFYTRYLYHPEGSGTPNCRIKFSSQFFGCKVPFPSETTSSKKGTMIIQDPSLFKRKLPLLSVLAAHDSI
jgi:hypothetical protein